MIVSPALLFAGICALTIQLVTSHVVKNERNCTVPYYNGEDSFLYFKNSFKVTCKPRDSTFKTFAMILCHQDKNLDQYYLHYVLSVDAGQEMWANLRCYDEKVSFGPNVARSRLIPENNYISLVDCDGSGMTIAEYKEYYHGSTIIEWTSDIARQT